MVKQKVKKSCGQMGKGKVHVLIELSWIVPYANWSHNNSLYIARLLLEFI